MQRKIIITATVLLFLLFLYAAFSKLIDFHNFVTQLKRSPLVGEYANVLAWVVPELEVLIAILLLLPRTRFIGLYSSFFLMLLFTVYVYVIPRFFSYVPCSCGGVIGKLSWTWHFWFNVFFTLLAAAAVTLYSNKKKAIAYK